MSSSPDWAGKGGLQADNEYTFASPLCEEVVYPTFRHHLLPSKRIHVEPKHFRRQAQSQLWNRLFPLLSLTINTHSFESPVPLLFASLRRPVQLTASASSARQQLTRSPLSSQASTLFDSWSDSTITALGSRRCMSVYSTWPTASYTGRPMLISV